jgi:hypothetical protein
LLANVQLGEYFEMTGLLGLGLLNRKCLLRQNSERLLVMTPGTDLVQKGDGSCLLGSNS